MLNRKQITREQALYAIENGEFGREMVASKSRVVIILTQSWCPQWRHLKSWVYEMVTSANIDIYELEYNTVDYFQSFMNFKEQKWHNYDVPYLRFYQEGSLIKETNYIGRQQFASILEIEND